MTLTSSIIQCGGGKGQKRMGLQVQKTENRVVPLGLHINVHNESKDRYRVKDRHMIITETTDGGTISDSMVDEWLGRVKSL